MPKAATRPLECEISLNSYQIHHLHLQEPLYIHFDIIKQKIPKAAERPLEYGISQNSYQIHDLHPQEPLYIHFNIIKTKNAESR